MKNVVATVEAIEEVQVVLVDMVSLLPNYFLEMVV